MLAEPAGNDASTLVSYIRSTFDSYGGGLPHYLGVAFRTRYVALMANMNAYDRVIALADIAAAEAAGEPLPLNALLRAELHDRFCAAFDAAADPTRTPIERAVGMLDDYAGCGLVLPLRLAGLLPDHPAHEQALRAILGLCRRVADESPAALVESMPRGCPGCLWLNLVAPVALHEALEPASRAVMCALLRDPRSRIVEPGELVAAARAVRSAYTRREDPFPYVANCLDFRAPFDMRPESINCRAGTLLASARFRLMMSHDADHYVRAAHNYLRHGPRAPLDDVLDEADEALRWADWAPQIARRSTWELIRRAMAALQTCARIPPTPVTLRNLPRKRRVDAGAALCFEVAVEDTSRDAVKVTVVDTGRGAPDADAQGLQVATAAALAAQLHVAAALVPCGVPSGGEAHGSPQPPLLLHVTCEATAMGDAVRVSIAVPAKLPAVCPGGSHLWAVRIARVSIGDTALHHSDLERPFLVVPREMHNR